LLVLVLFLVLPLLLVLVLFLVLVLLLPLLHFLLLSRPFPYNLSSVVCLER